MALVINGERVDDAVLDGEFSGIKAYFESLGNVSCCERNDEFRGYARENVIARVLLAQEASRNQPPVPDAQVDEAIAKLQAEHGGEQRFYAAIGGAGPEQLAAVRRDVELNLRVRTMLEQLVAGDPTPPDAELRAYYEQHIDAYKTLEEVRASHILKAPSRGEQRDAAYQELREVRAQLLAGADFDELARAHSDKAQDHIDLGFFKRGELAEEFELVAFSMSVGEISPVFVSPFGFHLVKLTERKPATPKPFEEVRQQVLEHYRQDRQQDKTRQLVQSLQARAVIEDEVPAPVA